jgi:hypothetical protein
LAGFLEVSGQRRQPLWAGLTLACGVALLTSVTACSSDGSSFFQSVGALTVKSVAGPEIVPQTQLTRAELNQIPYATIAVSSSGGPRAYLVPLADNGGYLDYRDEVGNSVRMLGGAVAAFESAGYDLNGVLHDIADPIAHPRPLAQWPAQVWREFQFTVRHLGPYIISLNCAFEPAGHDTIEIVEVSLTLTRVDEICTNARRQITNTYWIDEETGFIWKSEQWLGPKIGHVSIEVIRPYSG